MEGQNGSEMGNSHPVAPSSLHLTYSASYSDLLFSINYKISCKVTKQSIKTKSRHTRNCCLDLFTFFSMYIVYNMPLPCMYRINKIAEIKISPKIFHKHNKPIRRDCAGAKKTFQKSLL